MANNFIENFIDKITKMTKPVTPEERKQIMINQAKNQMVLLNKKRLSKLSNIRGVNMVKDITATFMVFTAGYQILFGHRIVGAFIAVGAYAIASRFFKFIKENEKEKIKQIDFEISNLDRVIKGEDIETVYKSNSFNNEEYTNNIKKPVFEAKMVEDEETEENEEKDSELYTEFIPEAKLAFDRLDILDSKIYEIASHDNELYNLFRSTHNSAVKTADLIKQDSNREINGFKFYNYVEMLSRWAGDIAGLYSKDVYDSLLVDLRNKAMKALPVLRAKIDEEYYKLINPTIMDLESEMEMMANER